MFWVTKTYDYIPASQVVSGSALRASGYKNKIGSVTKTVTKTYRDIERFRVTKA